MKNKPHDFQKLWARQRNVLPHDVIPNSGLFQGRLLSSTTATSPIQRIGKVVIGLFFLGLGCFFLAGIISDFMRHREVDVFGLMVAVSFVALGIPLGLKLNLDAAFPSARKNRQKP